MSKKIAGGVAGWVFGLSVSVFLIAMWGRAMVVDTETLAESMSPLSGAAPVVDLVAGWLGEEMVDAGLDAAVVDSTVRGIMTTPAVSRSLDRLVVEVVLAAGSTQPGGAVVDVAGVLRPALPEITEAVSISAGGMVPPAKVAELIDGLDPLVVVRAGSRPQVGPASPIATRLGTAAVLALITMTLSGAVAARSAPDSVTEVRKLLSRLALGALSFAVLLRIGSWVLSPTGGRAPVTSALSELAGAKWLVPMSVALTAGAASLGIRYLKRVRRAGAFPPSGESPTPRPAEPLSSPARR